MQRKPTVFVSGYYCRTAEYRVIRPAGRDDWFVAYTVSGEGRIGTEAGMIACCEGDLVVIKPGCPHHYETGAAGSWNFYWSHFHPPAEWMQWFAPYEPGSGVFRLHMEDSAGKQRTEASFRRLLEDNLDTSPLRDELCLNALQHVFLLAAKASRQSAAPACDPRIAEALRRLQHRMQEDIRVSDMAKSLSLSPSRFAHLFKQQVGESMKAAQFGIRMRQAALLLQHTSLPVGDIAREVGFADPFYFTRNFTRRFGISPSAFRNRHLRHSRHPQ